MLIFYICILKFLISYCETPFFIIHNFKHEGWAWCFWLLLFLSLLLL